MDSVPDVSTATVLRAGPFELSPDERALRIDGEIVAVTRREFQLLHLLFEDAGKPVWRDPLQREIWGEPGARPPGPLARRLRPKAVRQARRRGPAMVMHPHALRRRLSLRARAPGPGRA